MRRTTGQQRVPGLDAGRFLAAVGIVWLHTAGIGPATAPAGAIGRFAVPYFTLIAVALVVDGVARESPPDFARFARGRFARIYLPFLSWTAVYLLLRLAKHALRPSSPPPPVGPHLLFVGSAHHLWYLPFVLAVTVAARGASPLLVRHRRVGAVAAVVVGAGVALVPTSLTHHPYDPGFRNQINYSLMLGWSAAPSAFWGAATGLYLAAIASKLDDRPWVATGAALLTAALLVPGDGAPYAVLRASLAGVLFFVAVASLPAWRATMTLAGLGRHSFGIYASHVAYILALEAVMVRDRADFSGVQAIAIFSVAVAASLATTTILGRCRATSWAVT